MSCAPPAVRHVFELAEPAKPRKKYEHCYRRPTHPEYVRLQGNARTCERTRTASKVRRRMGVGRRGIHGPGTATEHKPNLGRRFLGYVSASRYGTTVS